MESCESTTFRRKRIATSRSRCRTTGWRCVPSRYSAAANIEDYELSPKGERALFVARGDIFTVPIEKGPTRNLTNSSDAHDRWARWSPDGRKIAFISDRSGEDQVYLIDQDGLGKPEQLTTDHVGMLYAAEWSPCGKRLAFSDKDRKLYVLTIEDKSLVEVARDKRGSLGDYAWSPHGGYLAFSLRDESEFSSLSTSGAWRTSSCIA